MSIHNELLLRVILYEGAGADTFSAAERYNILTVLLDKGYAVTHVRDPGNGVVAPADHSAHIVLGRFNGQLPPNQPHLRYHDLTGLDTGATLEKVETARAELNAPVPGAWKPWFPVIDYDRCTHCMQCLSFCLFGVYTSTADGKIKVQNEDNCKTNCPACSRVCPEVAIMFPKYGAGPINGDEVTADDVNREKMKVDISSLLGGDIYSLLRQRNERAKSRFAKERDADRALQERQKCLVKLKDQLDVPPEALMNLPSPDEILRRAEEAKAAAQQALARQQPQPNPNTT